MNTSLRTQTNYLRRQERPWEANNPGARDFDHNMIQKLFPDRAIKAQNFIDLLAANRKNDKQHLLRVQNPLARKKQDVELAVKDLVMQLKEQSGLIISLKRVEEGSRGDPCIYRLTLPEGKTSGLKPRSARTRFGAPYSHLPTDKALTMKVKLSLSGGVLMVQTGGGYKDILEFLEHKGFFASSQHVTL